MSRHLTAFTLVVVTFCPSNGYTQDAAQVVFDNDKVRATEFVVKPREKAVLRARAPYVLFCLNASVVDLTLHDGKHAAAKYSSEDLRWFDHAAQAIDNTGEENAMFLTVEIKKATPNVSRVAADDGTNIAPEQYGILLENDRARIIRVRVRPGEKTLMHSHPGSGFRYALEHGLKRHRFTFPDGTTREGQSQGKDARWSQSPSKHMIENIGTINIHNLLVEVR